MLGRTPAEAYHSFIEPIQSALNSILIGRLLLAGKGGRVSANVPLTIALNGGDRTPFRREGAPGLTLQIGLSVQVSPLEFGRFNFQCSQDGYWYSISTDDGNEVLAFHWAPRIRLRELPFPHLHVGSMVGDFGLATAKGFHKLHIPTGRISIQQVVRFVIEDLGAEVRPGMDKANVLAELNRGIKDF